MKRRALAMLLSLALLLSISAQAAGRVLLPRGRTYSGQFSDVSPESWYYPYVVAGYEYGLFNGRDGGFAPDATITLTELAVLSARIHAAYEGDTIPAAAEGERWDAPYLAYLAERALLPSGITDLGAEATRAQLAAIFARSLPAICYDNRNDALVTEALASGGYITDVNEQTPFRTQILWMYRQGLLAGMDAAGSYWPNAATNRAEAAAVVVRMIDPSLRVTPDWRVSPYRSAAGTTLGGLVEAPESAPEAPSYFDEAEIDAALRAMLAVDANTLTLRYPAALTRSDATTLVRAFSEQVKRYCEQMYNTVSCTAYNSGAVQLTFSALGCDGGTLARYREETMKKAIEVHDMLWETGRLTPEMSEYEIARVYFLWLCDHCEYDYPAMRDSYSVSHIAYSALLLGRAVCDGYTGAYNLFLKLEGIECEALANDDHIWTVATLDGTRYHIDVTWGDQGENPDESYFGMTAEESYRRHPW